MELEIDESELFNGDTSMESPPVAMLLQKEAVAAQAAALSDGESDSDDDGIVLDSEGSSSDEEEDEVEMQLRDRIMSLQSSLDPHAQMNGACVAPGPAGRRGKLASRRPAGWWGS